jgi:hypothetical protein
VWVPELQHLDSSVDYGDGTDGKLGVNVVLSVDCHDDGKPNGLAPWQYCVDLCQHEGFMVVVEVLDALEDPELLRLQEFVSFEVNELKFL